MDIEIKSNPSGLGEQGTRTLKIVSLGVGFIAIGLLFFIAFISFQPDQYSLSDRYFPSPTATATRTPTHTPTPNWTATQKIVETTATAQVVQTIVANANDTWPILLSDPFDNNDNIWNTGLDKSDLVDVRREINNGKYTWDVISKKNVITWASANTTNVTDFILSVDAQRTQGTSSSDYGLIFRYLSRNYFYYYSIRSDSFQLGLNYRGDWINIIDWRRSEAIHPNEVNHLTIIADGSHFTLLINDRLVAQAIDDHIEQGTTGVAISINRGNLEEKFEFDNFELRTP